MKQLINPALAFLFHLGACFSAASVGFPSVGFETEAGEPPLQLFDSANQYELITFNVSPSDGDQVAWEKNGEVMDGEHSTTLVLADLRLADQGIYQPWLVSGGVRKPGQKIVLYVNRANPLTNMSVRVNLSASKPNPIMGLVLMDTNVRSTVLFRCIGPGLKSFGVETPGAPLELIVRNASGKVMFHATPITSQQLVALPNQIPNQVAAYGCFPHVVGDVAQPYTLNSGAYTVEVVPSPDSNGDVLIEVYQRP